MVESGTLLRCYTSKRGIEGSNPSSSALISPVLQEERESDVEGRDFPSPLYTNKYTNAAPRESAAFTRQRSLVRTQHRPL